MKITKDNYEAWFLDYRGGNLSDEQVALLLAFLEKHPVLKEELEAYDEVSFAPEKFSYSDKSGLKLPDWTPEEKEEMILSYVEGLLDVKQKELVEKLASGDSSFKKELDLFLQTRLAQKPVVFGMNHLLKKNESLAVTEENRDLLLIAQMEGLLHSRQLDQKIEKDPSWKRAASLYAMTQLSADHDIVYPNKKELKRRDGLIISLNFYRSVAAVAAAVLGMMFWPSGNFNPEYSGREIQMAETNTSLIELEEVNDYSSSENIATTNYQLASSKKDQAVKKNSFNEEKLAPVEIHFAEEKILPIEENSLEPNLVIQEKDQKQNENQQELNILNNQEILAMTNGNSSDHDFLTPKEFISAKLNEKVFKGEKNKPLEKEQATHSVTEQISKLIGTPVSYVNKSEDERKVFEVSVGKFSFSRTRH